MQSASSRIWTRLAVSISYDDNHTPSFCYFISPFCFISSIFLFYPHPRYSLHSDILFSLFNFISSFPLFPLFGFIRAIQLFLFPPFSFVPSILFFSFPPFSFFSLYSVNLFRPFCFILSNPSWLVLRSFSHVLFFISFFCFYYIHYVISFPSFFFI